MFYKELESCPKLYECSRITMTPIIRTLLRCSADAAMKSICANCDERQEAQAVRKREKASFENES